jgi:ankyrin repeat protein
VLDADIKAKGDAGNGLAQPLEPLQHIPMRNLRCWLGLVGVIFAAAYVNGAQAREEDPMSREVEYYFEDAGVRALAKAAKRGNVEEIDRLIAGGVPVDGAGRKGWTPLAFALFYYRIESVKALLRHGANPNHRIYDLGYVTDMPVIMLIAGARMPELLEVMLEAGASPDARYGVPKKLGYPAEYPYEGDSLLIESIGDPELVRILLKHGAKVDLCVHSRPQTMAWTAAQRAASLGAFETLKLLLESGASARLDAAAWWLQERPWPKWAEPQRIESLKLLKKRGAKIYASEVNPQTPKELLSPGSWKQTECEDDKPVDLSKARDPSK